MLTGIGGVLIASSIIGLMKDEDTVQYLQRTGFGIGLIFVIQSFL